jgi:alpha-beta hydrolase superfamily lysophospholipase
MTIYRYVKCIYSSKKIFVIAESMGGCVILKSCLKYNLKLDGVILLAPLCGVNDELLPSQNIINLVLKISYYFPSYKMIGTHKMNEGCCNPKYNLLKTLNKYAYKGKFRLSTSRECYLSSRWVFENKEKFNLPILAIHSMTDKVTCYKKTKSFIDHSSSVDKELFLLEDGHHTLLVPLFNKDYQPIIILSKIINWRNNRLYPI